MLDHTEQNGINKLMQVAPIQGNSPGSCKIVGYCDPNKRRNGTTCGPAFDSVKMSQDCPTPSIRSTVLLIWSILTSYVPGEVVIMSEQTGSKIASFEGKDLAMM